MQLRAELRCGKIFLSPHEHSIQSGKVDRMEHSPDQSEELQTFASGNLLVRYYCRQCGDSKLPVRTLVALASICE